ncbi:MAG TPA: hypothetical protein VFR35_13470 [Actinoplanes sp.]|nr:hypothetical protein [Actinoplanes sp.]
MDKDHGPIPPVSHFVEPDYCYGTGSLTMRVERIDWARPVQYDGENWYEVEGIEIASDGRVIGRRQALVRGRRLSSSPLADRGRRA